MKSFVWKYRGPTGSFTQQYEARDRDEFLRKVVNAIGDGCASQIEYTGSERGRRFQAALNAAHKRAMRERAVLEGETA